VGTCTRSSVRRTATTTAPTCCASTSSSTPTTRRTGTPTEGRFRSGRRNRTPHVVQVRRARLQGRRGPYTALLDEGSEHVERRLRHVVVRHDAEMVKGAVAAAVGIPKGEELVSRDTEVVGQFENGLDYVTKHDSLTGS